MRSVATCPATPPRPSTTSTVRPCSPAGLRRSLLRPSTGPTDIAWTSVEVVTSTGSTNADLAAASVSGTARAGAVLLAEQQTDGRGRLARSWESPARSGLTLSVLLAPTRQVASWGWLPLVTGLAVVDGIRAATDLETTLKWPNDVLAADGLKLGGILAERVDASDGHAQVVVGIGLNVSSRPDELPVPTATSLVLAGAERNDRQTLAVCVLRALARRLTTWQDGVDPAADYRSACSTLGRQVRVERPARGPLLGTAVDLDGDGRLVVEGTDRSRTAVAAGDVVHLR